MNPTLRDVHLLHACHGCPDRMAVPGDLLCTRCAHQAADAVDQLIEGTRP